MARFFGILVLAAIASAVSATQPLHNNATVYPDKQCAAARYQHKHRIFVFSDISNEPDDQMSLVRFLTYANEIDIQGFSLITSTWKNDSLDAATVIEVINAYGNVTENLNAHVPAGAEYPSAQSLLDKVYEGHPVYGLAALELPLSGAAVALIAAIDAGSPSDPLWVTMWGGANILAEALQNITHTRNSTQVDDFVSKVHVYSISDQDNAGPWIRLHYPKLMYIVSLTGFNEYLQAAWNGISGEEFRHFDQGGPDTSLVTNDWLETHIRVGPLGAHYPNFTFIMEGDTPSFFPLINNGLQDPNHIEWGSWGGRYLPHDNSRVSSNTYADADDVVLGQSGYLYVSNFATIWRWRHAYQWDFASRMSWTLNSDFAAANHAPVAIVNDTCGPEFIHVPWKFPEPVVLDARESWDPDNDGLNFEWWHYREATQRYGEGSITAVSDQFNITALDSTGGLVEIRPNASNVNETAIVNAVSWCSSALSRKYEFRR
jgi:hypothetical protein